MVTVIGNLDPVNIVGWWEMIGARVLRVETAFSLCDGWLVLKTRCKSICFKEQPWKSLRAYVHVAREQMVAQSCTMSAGCGCNPLLMVSGVLLIEGSLEYAISYCTGLERCHHTILSTFGSLTATHGSLLIDAIVVLGPAPKLEAVSCREIVSVSPTLRKSPSNPYPARPTSPSSHSDSDYPHKSPQSDCHRSLGTRAAEFPRSDHAHPSCLSPHNSA